MEVSAIEVNGRKNSFSDLSQLEMAHYKNIAHELPALTMTERQVSDFELIINGGFSPLTNFMSKADYDSVLDHMRLTDGTIWPVPVMLDAEGDFAEALQRGQEITLRDTQGLLLAILKFNECWEIDHQREAQALFGTIDGAHKGVAYLYQETKQVYLSGELLVIAVPAHYDYMRFRSSPHELKNILRQRGWQKTVAYQAHGVMHRSQQALTQRVCEQLNANLLLHPMIGVSSDEYDVRVRCYERILKTYPNHHALLSLLPLAMRMGGPREIVWRAIIHRNYGCTHFIVESSDELREAQALAVQYQQQIGIEMIVANEMLYSEKRQQYVAQNDLQEGEVQLTISDAEMVECLSAGRELPVWFSYPAVIEVLQKAYLPRHQQGFTLLMTGLPCAGKRTIAKALLLRLRELTGRAITLLDDECEQGTAQLGLVAKEVTRHGGIVICALVAPVARSRDELREMVVKVGGFIEAYVSTPLEVCEKRDAQGRYNKARAGLIRQFAGVSEVYEAPLAPDITISTEGVEPVEIIEAMVKRIRLLGFVK